MEYNMNKGMLLVAVGCGRLPGILDIVKKHSFVVFGTMDESPVEKSTLIKDSPVYFYETGWIVPRRVVAVGKLKKIWLGIQQDISAEEFADAFEEYFGSSPTEVLNAIDMSFEYNVYNNAYFSAGDIELINDVTLDKLIEEKGLYRAPNVVVS